LNKQFGSKDKYEKEVAKIVEKMIEDKEWGEFFPQEFSPFGFNETFAIRNYKLTKAGALGLGFKWQDDDYGLKYDGEFYEPNDDIQIYRDSEEERKKLLSGILKCEKSGKPFKIIPQELAFCLKEGHPIPRKHFKVRMDEMFEWSNPRHLWHRQCMCENSGHDHEGKCKNEFETTYAPDRPEKVYCEDCYQKSVV
jgi:hypothetical protein